MRRQTVLGAAIAAAWVLVVVACVVSFVCWPRDPTDYDRGYQAGAAGQIAPARPNGDETLEYRGWRDGNKDFERQVQDLIAKPQAIHAVGLAR